LFRRSPILRRLKDHDTNNRTTTNKFSKSESDGNLWKPTW